MHSQKLRLFGLGVVVLASLTACSLLLPPEPLTAGHVVGTWEHKGDAGSVELRADGSFTMNQVPLDAVDSSEWDIGNLTGVPVGPPVDVTGTWSVQEESDAFGPPYVLLEIDETSGLDSLNTSLQAYGSGEVMQLEFVLGDPDSLFFYSFTRIGSSE
jgi:hypothetical protein